MQYQFTIDKPNQVNVRHYTGKNSLYDKSTYWGFTYESLQELVNFFNRFGFQTTIDDFKFMINYLHNHNIGAILDFIPGHFASDDFGLKKFDGTAMYEPRKIDQILSLRYWFYHYGANHFDFTKKENSALVEKFWKLELELGLGWTFPMHFFALLQMCHGQYQSL